MDNVYIIISPYRVLVAVKKEYEANLISRRVSFIPSNQSNTSQHAFMHVTKWSECNLVL